MEIKQDRFKVLTVTFNTTQAVVEKTQKVFRALDIP